MVEMNLFAELKQRHNTGNGVEMSWEIGIDIYTLLCNF